MEEWFLALTARGKKEAHSLAILTTWHIWKEMNARIFDAKRGTEQGVLMRIKDELADWCSARRGVLRLQRVVPNNMSN
jgi:hypothetical protein